MLIFREGRMIQETGDCLEENWGSEERDLAFFLRFIAIQQSRRPQGVYLTLENMSTLQFSEAHPI